MISKTTRLLLAAMLLAAPAFGQATGHSGVLSAGESVTISGANFGVKSPAAPVLFDDFEQHADDYIFADGWDAPGGTYYPPEPWDPWYYSNGSGCVLARPVVTVQDTFVADGRGMVLQYRQPSGCPTSYQSKEFTATGKFIIDADARVGVFGGPTEVENMKPFRMTYNNDSYTAIWYNTWCGGSGRIGAQTSGTRSSTGITTPAPWWDLSAPRSYADGLMADWFNWTLVVGESSEGGAADGYGKNYFNCRAAGEISNWLNRPDVDHDFSYNSLHIGGQSTTNNCPPGTTYDADAGAYMWWDHIYLDNTWQRIEIGNAPVYDNCTERTIQIPTAWSAAEVTFTARTDQFANGDPAWVFLIDADNEPIEMVTGVSEGYPMIVDDDTDPEAPGIPGQPQNVTGTEN